MDVPILDLPYPLDDADPDVSSEQLRRMAAKQLKAWKEKYDEVNELYGNASNLYTSLITLRNRANRMMLSAEIYMEMVEELTKEPKDE